MQWRGVAEPGALKRTRYTLEAALAVVMFGFFRLLPLQSASAVGGFVARTIGPRLGVSERARHNIRLALPELSAAEIERVVHDMWDNLGRVTGELPHLGRFRVYEPGGRVERAGVIDRLKANGPGPGEHYIFFSAHYGNWEIATMAATQGGFDTIEIYRAANNPFVDRMIQRARGVVGSELVPKGSQAGRRAIAAIRDGRHICLLVDQKMNEGIAVPFFGRDAMTDSVIGRLALRYNCRLMPARVERLEGANFRITVDEAMELPHSGDIEADVKALMTAINAKVESWVRERPEQWFWLHRRWPD